MMAGKHRDEHEKALCAKRIETVVTEKKSVVILSCRGMAERFRCVLKKYITMHSKTRIDAQ